MRVMSGVDGGDDDSDANENHDKYYACETICFLLHIL